MKKRLFLLVAIVMASSVAVAARLPEPVAAALARARVPLDAVGIVVEPVESGPVAINHRADVPMNPASTMKLVTTFAALDLLGPAFTFRTDFLLQGALDHGALDGNLVIRGGGDPKLTYERLWQAAHQLRARGLREVRGDVIVDRGYFAPLAHDPGKFDGESRRAYNVGADAFLVNFQAVNFTVVPDGSGARVTLEPDLPNVQVVSRIAVVPGACNDWRRALKVEFDENGLIATVVVSGNFPSECGEKTWPLALLDGPRYSEAAWRWVWSEAGGVLRGKVRAGATPADARLFYRHESEPLAALVRDMNKFSNNVMATQMYLALSAERAAPGEARASEVVLRDWLKGRAIDAPGFSIENGSGLSRSDRITPQTLATLLRTAWASGSMPEIVASLPIFAVDGTLKLRKPGTAAGHAHLKGGTLAGVQSMAGYVLDARGRRWVVVMIVNHPNANAAQPALDALVEWVYRLPGRNVP
jgi:D-alanyl-D-alanine carboxypeptidase/D-alanyl-D-alanine-endopeptidase (penicillin-binding protein 4)